ncbi:FluC/FEX family fluoride channel [Micropruina sonneratiae]|uniref:FluC/FEX family fluoride channel n=1 Tax=Micropruina sonneratiae TaxID=2986940 RepID=UPI002227910E|nr:CrcB family protein [Micropruina sp. KQZ13P-5]MCW3157241.1 CrcB family protein [Micropruina sp. KQZ13P-5]
MDLTAAARRLPGGRSAVVLVGGTIGTAFRAALEAAFPAQPGGWPWATFLINLSGAFLLGLLLETLSRRGPDVGVRQYLRLGVGTGVMGGYTTYSTFAVETVRLLEHGAVLAALGYAVASVLLGLAGALGGMLLAGRLVRRATP